MSLARPTSVLLRKFSAAVLLLCSVQVLPASLPELVNQGQRSAVMELLVQGVNVNEQSVDGTSALHWAVYHQDVELAQSLLDLGADPDMANEYGATPMTVAAEHGQLAIMRLLIEAGGDIKSPNGEGQTLLMSVARTGNTGTAQLLLENGADVNARENWGGQTALMWASAQRHPDMVRLLAAHGSDVNARSHGHDWQRLVTSEPRKKQLDQGGFTPLLYAAREGCEDCVTALLDAGADINMPGLWGRTPLLMALENLHYDTAGILVERGADINRWDWWGRTPLYSAIDLNLLTASRRGDLPSTDKLGALDIARNLLERGTYVDMRLKKEPPFRSDIGDRGYTDASPDSRVINGGATALHKAAKAGDVEAVQLLLEFGANVNVANKVYGVSPVHTAAGVWRVYGIFKETPISGMYKTGEQAAQIMDMLVGAGADIHALAANGQNVAHGAAKAGWHEALRFAFDQGVDFTVRDVGGYTPKDLAEMAGKTDTAKFIDQLVGN